MPRYIVTEPVPDGNPNYEVHDTQSAEQVNRTVGIIPKWAPLAKQAAHMLRDRWNALEAHQATERDKIRAEGLTVAGETR
jgi:hypothetical protein